jgi:hypothetical protein
MTSKSTYVTNIYFKKGTIFIKEMQIKKWEI